MTERTPTINRRHFTAGLIGAAGLTAAGALTSQPAHADGGGDGFASVRRLRRGHPGKVGLDGDALRAGWEDIMVGTEPATGEDLPLYAGAVLLYVHEGRIVLHEAGGSALRYADAERELDPSEQIAMDEDTIFDMASISKLFTSIVVMQQVEKGRIDLDATVASYLPDFAAGGKEEVTVRMMLTHTSGLPASLPLWKDYPDIPSRIAATLAEPAQDAPGTEYLYSDLNLITLAVLVQEVSGRSLDHLVTKGITLPLGMFDTGYNPWHIKQHRCAATEYVEEPDRGMVWGEVHDENAWSFDGVAGHAGVFSTARDMAVLSQAMLNGGWYGYTRILSEESVTAMITNENTDFPGDDHGLGFEINQDWYMGELSSSQTVGHTGFTGTSLVIDYATNSSVILLTNRVHPSRDGESVNPARVDAADALVEAMG